MLGCRHALTVLLGVLLMQLISTVTATPPPTITTTNPWPFEDEEEKSNYDASKSIEERLSNRINHETILIQDVFRDYDKVARPVINMSDAVEVKFAVRLLSIQLNEVDQILTSFVWLPHAWTDERLTWNPALYGGITMLIIPNRKLWLPDTFLYQSADDHGYLGSLDRVPVTSDGVAEWWPSSTLRSPCTIDVTYFPFDTQECTLTLGPWGYHAEQVNYTLIHDDINLDRYKVSGAWELQNHSIKRQVQFYPDLNMSYTLVDVTFNLRRKALYYWLNVIAPCLFLNCLSIGLFILPADSGEKVGFGLGILLTVFVFTILVNENIPKTSDYTPIIGIYLVLMMSTISSSLFLAIIIVNLHHRRPKLGAVPGCIKAILLGCVPKMLCMRLPKLPLYTGLSLHSITPKKQRQARLHRFLRKESAAQSVAMKTSEQELERLTTSIEGKLTTRSNGEAPQTRRSPSLAEDEYEDARTEQQRESERLEEAYRDMPFDEKNNDEWIMVALVLDKLLFWIYLTLLLLSSSLVLIIIPAVR